MQIIDFVSAAKTRTLTPNVKQALIHAGAYIQTCQQKNGAILWHNNHKLDPWDHCEALMGLNCLGHFSQVKKALQWLYDTQNADGSWYAKYYGKPQDNDKDRQKVDSNFVAYTATALWHFYLCSKDLVTTEYYFPMVGRAIDYVVTQQTLHGDIQWAQSDSEQLPCDALITGCSSILRSLHCATQLNSLFNPTATRWHSAHKKLAHVLKHCPWRFDRTWESKQRFSMDWFYPVLSGVLNPQESQARLTHHWQKFVVDNLGCRCVSDEPWITIAESCELCIALVAAGNPNQAEKLFLQLLRWQDHDGGFWTGYVYRDQAIWPEEKTSWTAAAIILAADAIYQLTPAAEIFTQPASTTDNSMVLSP